MSAETLRRAASLMRERAERATAGPWLPVTSGVEGAGTVLHDKHVMRCDAEHIASWHPHVALAVVTVLGNEADLIDHFADYEPRPDLLAFARAYLGESA